ncbi:MAG TPA: Rpn family recombination-promoting nuclease/putative transposase [Planctomycetota bacterium]|nr:Rpn family recombination-promoting nuclease/putative transposase [Planctomycetota bacterium]
MDQPHDTLFRTIFAQPEHAAALLRSALPLELAAAIDWPTLAGVEGSFIDAASQRHHSDLLFRVDLGGAPALLYLLLEHKSYDDAWTVLQVLRHVVNIWHWWREQHPGVDLLPPVLPIVVHHGDHPFRSPTRLLDLVRLDQLPAAVAEALRRHQPQLQVLIDDLASQSEADLRRRVDGGGRARRPGLAVRPRPQQR